MPLLTFKNLFLAIVVLAIVLGIGIAPVGAQQDLEKIAEEIRQQDTNIVGAALNRIINRMFGLLLALAVLFIIVAAYNYLFSAGEPEKVKTATRMITYAVIAIAVAALARGIVFIVRQLILP